MDSLSNAYAIHRERFQSLLSSSNYDEQLAEEVWKALVGIYDSLAMRAEALQAFAEAMQASSEPWLAFDHWPFTESTHFYNEQDRELLLGLPNGTEMVALLDESEAYRLQISVLQEALKEKILDVWRGRNPKFSSMGIVDSHIQSETLKDMKPFARR